MDTFSVLLLNADAGPIGNGIMIFLVLILIILAIKAFFASISGAVVGAFIGPIFLDLSVGEGIVGGAVIFAILAILGEFQTEKS